MLIRRGALLAGSGRDPVARRLEAIANIRRREEAHSQEMVRRHVEPRFVVIKPAPHGQDAA